MIVLSPGCGFTTTRGLGEWEMEQTCEENETWLADAMLVTQKPSNREMCMCWVVSLVSTAVFKREQTRNSMYVQNADNVICSKGDNSAVQDMFTRNGHCNRFTIACSLLGR